MAPVSDALAAHSVVATRSDNASTATETMPAAQLDEKLDRIVAQMTLEEKLSLVHGDVILDDNGTGKNPCVGHLPAIERLGIPAVCMGDGPEGVGNGMTGVTQFPAPVAGAATWNAGLMREFGAALGAEQAAKGRNVVLAPTINILRTPLWGRAAETLSEDPFLTARLGVAIVEGIQSRHVLATPKHFAANNQETLRLGDAPNFVAVDAEVSERALREIYLPAFQAVVQEAHAGSIMCAYNRVNSVYACENPFLFDVLRKEWGFDGFVVSDWYFAHRSTEAAAKAGLDVSMPGGASPFGFQDFYGDPLRAAVVGQRIPIARLDEMVRNILRPTFRAGLRPISVSADPNLSARSEEHDKLSLIIASQGTVLLKNAHSVLPIDEHVRSIAVIGDDASEHVKTTERYGGFVGNAGIAITSPFTALTRRAGNAIKVRYERGTLGIGALPSVPSAVLRTIDGRAGGLTARWYSTADFSGEPIAQRIDSAVDVQARPPGLPKLWSVRWSGYLSPVSTGLYRFSLAGGGDLALYVDGQKVAEIRKQGFTAISHGLVRLTAGKRVRIRIDYSMSPTISVPAVQWGWQPPDSLLHRAVALARQSDLAIVFAADDISEGGDRFDLNLPADQNELIAAVAEANPNTVVVLHSGSAVLMPWLTKVAGVLECWYPGEAAGGAIATVLFGDVNPSGKLPLTFPASQHQGPATAQAGFPGIDERVLYSEELRVGYRYYDQHHQQALFPFGFGLSYTTFKLSNLRIEREESDRWRVSGSLENKGARRGAEVVQLYVGFPPVADEPPWQLKAFERIELGSGELREFSFELDRESLSYWSPRDRRWVLPTGSFLFALGSSSRALELQRTVDIEIDEPTRP